MIKPKLREKSLWFLLRQDLYWSPAFQEILKMKSAVNLLIAFIGEMRCKRAMNSRMWLNNSFISYTESEFYNEGLGSSSTYLRARNKLIEVGFIQITYRGGFTKGDCNMYRILVPGRDVPDDEQRWRFYPQKNWKHEIPKEKTNQVGIKTRYTPKDEGDTSPIDKGVSGEREIK